MKTWRLTTKQPGKPRTKQPDPETILIEADRLLITKTGALVFARSDAEDSGWGPNADDPFYQIDGFTITHVQAPGTFTKCTLLEHNHDRKETVRPDPGETH